MNSKGMAKPDRQTPDDLNSEGALAEGDAKRIGSTLHLAEGLRPQAGGDSEKHMELPELQRLAEEHRRTPGEKNVPEHLTICAICLDLFQTILAGVPAVSRQAHARFERLGDTSRRRIYFGWFSSTHVVLRAAAVLVILLAIGILSKPVLFPNSPVTTQGSFAMANGVAVPAGGALPARKPFTMSQGSVMALNDGGTAVRAETASEMSFARSVRGNPEFTVRDGDVWVKAAKQKSGSFITVRTPLGDIRVIGTEFRVTVEKEQVVVHERRPDQPETTQYASTISAVVVGVREGTIALRNQHERVSVTAGQTAVLRQNQSWIEVRQQNP